MMPKSGCGLATAPQARSFASITTDTIKLGKFGGPLDAVPIPPELHRTWTVEQDFIHAILDPNAPRPKPDFIEGLRYMRVVQAVAVAEDSGEKQRVC